MEQMILFSKKQRKTTLSALILFLFVSLTGQAYGADIGNELYTSVGLKYGNHAVNECVIDSDFGFQLADFSTGTLKQTLPLPGYLSLKAKADHGAIVVTDLNGIVLSSDIGTTGCIFPVGEDGTGVFTFQGKKYRGGLKFKIEGSSGLTVINYLKMDHYLYGVIHGEMGQGNPLEALKAQTVAARSFAVANNLRHGKDGFELCATSHCQMYQGVSYEYPKTIAAVDETSGIVLQYEGKTVQGYYSKNNGGYTQDSKDVWGTSCGYLKAMKDSYSPYYPWTATLSFSEIQSKLLAANYHPGTVTGVFIASKNENGTVNELKITGTEENVVLAKEKIRTVLGTNTIKSAMFSVSENGTPQTGQEIMVSNGTSTSKYTDGFCLLSPSESRKLMSGEEIYLVSANGIAKIFQGNSSSSTTSKTSSVTFTGQGYGHGVGMAQDSAIAMAAQNFTYDEILKFFYTGISLTSLN